MGSIDWRRGSFPAAVLLVMCLAAACTNPQPSTAPSQQPSTSPSATASAAPSTGPSVAPSEEPAASPSTAGERFQIDIPLTIATAHSVTARVVDWTGVVTGATSGTPRDGASVPYDQVVITNAGDSALDVTWVGGPCDRTVSVVLNANPSTLTVVQEPCGGDAIGFDRIVRLQLDRPIDASSIEAVLQQDVDTQPS